MEKLYIMEGSSLPYLLNPVSVAAFFATLFVCFVVSPRIRLYLAKACGELPECSTKYFDTLLGSTVHAVVVVAFTFYIMAFGLLGEYRVISKSPLGFITLQVSLGYFVADIVITLLDPKLRSDNIKGSLMHHLAGIIGIGLCLYFQGKLMYFIVGRLISEASTPFVNLRWILNEFHITDGKLFKTAAYGMLVTFFTARIVTMPWYWYETYHCFMHPAGIVVDPFLKVWPICIFLVFDMLNLYWFYRIARGVITFYNRQKQH